MKVNSKLWLVFLLTFIRRKKKQIGLATLIVLVLISSLFLIINHITSQNTLVEGLVGTYREEDLPDVVTKLLSKSLVTIDAQGLPKENLLSQIKSNNEATVYDLKLKNNLFWSDGSKIKSSDINISLPGVKVSYPDLSSFQLKVDDSFSLLPSLLVKPVFKPGTFIGLGPYKITNIQKDLIFVKKLELSPVDSKNKNLPKIVIKFYANERTARTALKLGEVEALLSVNELSDLSDQKTLSVLRRDNYSQLVTIFYNTKDSILSDENFRLALSFAAPIIKDENQAKTSIPPTSWAFNPDVKNYLNNFDQAKASLAKVKNGKDSTITLTVTQSLEEVGKRVVENWQKLGIKAVLRVESGLPQNFQSLLIAQKIPADPDQYSLWHSTQTETNISKFASPRIDKDLEDGRKILDQEVRKARYQDFQKVLLDHAPATFLYFPKQNIIYRKKAEEKLNKVLNLQLQ